MQQAPSYMQNAPKTRTDETAQASMPRLSFNLKGKFVYKQGGEETILGPEVEIIILAITPPENFVNHRSYWIDKFSGSDGGQPDCYSELGQVPHPLIAEPQAAKCADCPHAVLGSGEYGKSAACKSFKVIYGVFEGALHEVFAFKVPITSLKNLGIYRYDLKIAGAPIAGVITKVSFDPDAAYTKPVFAFAGYLPEKEFKLTTTMAAQEGIAGLLQAATEVPQLEAPDEKPVLIQEEFDFGEDDPVATILEDLNLAGTKEALQAKYNAHKATIATWGAEDKQNVKSLVTRKLQGFQNHTRPEPPSPTEACRLKLKNLTDKSLLPDLASDAVKYGLEGEFTEKAAELNGEAYDPEKHGTTKGGLPALCKDGSFKARRGGSKKTEAEEANDEELDDLLEDLGLDEI